MPICDPATTTCSFDLILYADAAGTQAIIDVMGYFMKPGGLGTLKTFTNTSTSGSTTFLPTSGACTNYSGGSVTITTPGPGEIFVQAKVATLVNHASGEYANYGIAEGSATTCSGVGFYVGYSSYMYMASNQPAGQYLIWDTVTLKYTATSAGTHTFYLNGSLLNGATNSVAFYYSGMNATFRPQ